MYPSVSFCCISVHVFLYTHVFFHFVLVLLPIQHDFFLKKIGNILFHKMLIPLVI